MRISALIVSLLLTANIAVAHHTNTQLSRDPTVQTEQIKAIVREVFAGEPEWIVQTFIKILRCESEIKHIEKDGSLVSNPNSSAAGVAQILLQTHGKEIERLNLDLDLTQIRDHLTYAKFLITRKMKAGQDPFLDWNPSRSCWKS